jgi:hypothetical protein
MRVLYFRSFKDLQIRDKEPCSYLDDACFLLSIVPRNFTALVVFSLYHSAFSPLLAWVSQSVSTYRPSFTVQHQKLLPPYLPTASLQ